MIIDYEFLSKWEQPYNMISVNLQSGSFNKFASIVFTSTEFFLLEYNNGNARKKCARLTHSPNYKYI